MEVYLFTVLKVEVTFERITLAIVIAQVILHIASVDLLKLFRSSDSYPDLIFLEVLIDNFSGDLNIEVDHLGNRLPNICLEGADLGYFLLKNFALLNYLGGHLSCLFLILLSVSLFLNFLYFSESSLDIFVLIAQKLITLRDASQSILLAVAKHHFWFHRSHLPNLSFIQILTLL